jgi:hypothetical protein
MYVFSGATTLSIMAFSVTTLSIMVFSITTICITTLSIRTFSRTALINNKNATFSTTLQSIVMLGIIYAEYLKPFMLNVIMLNVIMLCLVAPFLRFPP